MFMIQLETPNHVFHAFGKTAEEAKFYIWAGWLNHCRNANLIPEESTFPTRSSLEGNYNIIEVKVPSCVRDMEKTL